MTSFQLSISPEKEAGAYFISLVRRAIQQALAEEQATRGLTQSDVAKALGVHRSVIHRQIFGFENMGLGRVGELAYALGREAEFGLSRAVTILSNEMPPTTSKEGRVDLHIDLHERRQAA